LMETLSNTPADDPDKSRHSLIHVVVIRWLRLAPAAIVLDAVAPRRERQPGGR
jgi:hypothetical protein